MRPGAIAPGVPVADEHPVVGAGRGFVLGARVEPFVAASEELAVGKDLHREGDAIARRRHLQGGDLERIIGDLHALAAVEAEAPDLGGARSGRQEVEAATVRSPARAGVVGGVLREAARLSVLGPQVQQPQVGAAFVGVDVGLAEDERDVAAVGGQLWIAEPFEANQILDGQRRRSVVRRRVCQAGSADKPGRGDEASDHDGAPSESKAEHSSQIGKSRLRRFCGHWLRFRRQKAWFLPAAQCAVRAIASVNTP